MSSHAVLTGAKLGLVVLATVAFAAPAIVHADDRVDGYCYMRKKEARTDGAIIGAVAGGAIGGTVSNTKHKGVGTVLGAAVGAAVGANIGRDSIKCYNGEYHSFERGNYAPPSAPAGYETVYYRSRPDATYYSRVEYSSSTSYDDGNGGYVQKDVHYQGYPPPQQTYSQPAYSQSTYSDPAYSRPTTSTTYTQVETVAPSADDGDRSRGNYAVQGYRDDQGYWHRGQPRAVGWQDENGDWHEGQIVAYGWRDSQGHWHEDHSDDHGDDQTHYNR